MVAVACSSKILYHNMQIIQIKRTSITTLDQIITLQPANMVLRSLNKTTTITTLTTASVCPILNTNPLTLATLNLPIKTSSPLLKPSILMRKVSRSKYPQINYLMLLCLLLLIMMALIKQTIVWSSMTLASLRSAGDASDKARVRVKRGTNLIRKP